MEITPYYGDGDDALVIRPDRLVIEISPEERERVLALVGRAKVLREVTDEISFQAARRVAGELKGMEKEIYESKRAAKRPWEAILATIEQLATDVWAQGKAQQERLLGSLNGYVAQLEAAKKAQEEKKAAEQRAKEEEAKRAMAQAKTTEELAKAQQLQFEQELAADLDKSLAPPPPPGLVPGGRVAHPYKFKLVDLPAVINNHRLELLRWELNIPACNDAVRLQLERNPDRKPVLPGIEITQEISVSVKAQTRSK